MSTAGEDKRVDNHLPAQQEPGFGPISPATGAPALLPVSSTASEENALPQRPGPDFKLSKFLPDSVYFWACGERSDDEPQQGVPLLRSECLAAWVVLITQVASYLLLWNVSSGKNPFDLEAESSTSMSDATSPPTTLPTITSTASWQSKADNSGDFNFVVVAAAMYLMLSIAAADVWGAVLLLLEGPNVERSATGISGIDALLFEGRSDKPFWQRKAFGLGLLCSFVWLIVSSTSVLFYTSLDDVALLIGAAAVLFIADVLLSVAIAGVVALDEKAMAVLKNVDSKWRLFWVLQAIGLSAGLALLALVWTHNTGATSTNRHGGCEGGVMQNDAIGYRWSCELYSVYFIFVFHPVGATACSFVFSRVVDCPNLPLVMFSNWLGYGSPNTAPRRHNLEELKLLMVLCYWALASYYREINFWPVLDMVVLLRAIIFAVWHVVLNRCPAISLNVEFRACVCDPCFAWAMCLGVTLLAAPLVDSFAFGGSTAGNLLIALSDLAADAWAMFGLYQSRSALLPNARHSPAAAVLWGWGLSEIFFAAFYFYFGPYLWYVQYFVVKVWPVMLAAILHKLTNRDNGRTRRSMGKDMVFWMTATYFVHIFAHFARVWIDALLTGAVKFS